MRVLAPYDGDFDLVRIARGTSAPSSPVTGDVWIDTDASATGSAMELINEEVLASTATSVIFASIPATYRHLMLVCHGRTDRAGTGRDPIQIKFNNDGSALYYYETLGYLNATATAAGNAAQTSGESVRFAAATAPAGAAGGGSILIPNYAGTAFHKTWNVQSTDSQTDLAAGQELTLVGGRYASTTAISRIDLTPSTGANLLAGSMFSLYGMAA